MYLSVYFCSSNNNQLAAPNLWYFLENWNNHGFFNMFLFIIYWDNESNKTSSYALNYVSHKFTYLYVFFVHNSTKTSNKGFIFLNKQIQRVVRDWVIVLCTAPKLATKVLINNHKNSRIYPYIIVHLILNKWQQQSYQSSDSKVNYHCFSYD
jgi:hypothetical protein